MRPFGIPALLLVALIVVPSVQSFDLAWTDMFGESTYVLSGPDSLVVGDQALIMLAAADPLYPDAMIAGPWQFLVDGVELDGGFAIWLTAGSWIVEYPFVFQDVGSYTFTFRAQDHGHGGGMQNWQWFELTGVTEVAEPNPPSDVPEESPPPPACTWGSVKGAFLAR